MLARRRSTGRTRAPLLGVVALLIAAGAAAEPTRVGVGDARDGYERGDYRTDSRHIVAIEPGPGVRPLDVTPAILGLPPVPGAEALDAARVALGQKLFFDRRLSFSGVLSCGMCHVPEQGFAQNELATPVGTEGRFVRRNAPSLYNVAYRPRLFHDGREVSLENQVWSPLLASNEMGNPSVGSVLERLTSLPDYDGLFEAAFGRGPTMETLGGALASYERTLVSADSPFDRYYFEGATDALSVDAVRGFEVFRASGCTSCHLIGAEDAQFTDDAYHDTGIGYRNAHARGQAKHPVPIAPGVMLEVNTVPPPPDLGRYEATGRPEDRWSYRTPTLRNVALTAPYMHDGSMATLEEVIDYYDAGGFPHPGQDPRIRPLGLDEVQRRQLAEFLRSLTGSNVDALARAARTVSIGDY